MIPAVPRGRARATLLALALAVALVTAVVPVGAAPAATPPATPAASRGAADVYLVHGVNLVQGVETSYPVTICTGTTRVTSLSFGQTFRWTGRPIGGALNFTVRDGANASCFSGKVLSTKIIEVEGPSAVILDPRREGANVVVPLDTSCIGPESGRLTVAEYDVGATTFRVEGPAGGIDLGAAGVGFGGQPATITLPAAAYEVVPRVKFGSLPIASVDVGPQTLTAVFYVGNVPINPFGEVYTRGRAVVIDVPVCRGDVYLVNLTNDGTVAPSYMTVCTGTRALSPANFENDSSARIPALLPGTLPIAVYSGNADCSSPPGQPLATTSVEVGPDPALVVITGPSTEPRLVSLAMTGCIDRFDTLPFDAPERFRQPGSGFGEVPAGGLSRTVRNVALVNASTTGPLEQEAGPGILLNLDGDLIGGVSDSEYEDVAGQATIVVTGPAEIFVVDVLVDDCPLGIGGGEDDGQEDPATTSPGPAPISAPAVPANTAARFTG
jgi:hypothetical protein